MNSPNDQTPTSHRHWWVSLGIFVSATSAALSSFDGLRSLALAAGWTVWMSPLLPLTVDAFAATATRVWLTAPTASLQARRFARNCAVGAILLSLIGNAVWHLIAAELVPVSWVVVLCVGAVPAGVLGLVSHLAVLRRQVDVAVPADEPRTDRTVPLAGGAVLVPARPLSTRPDSAVSGPEDGPAKPPAVRRQGSAATQGRPHYGSEDVLMAAARAADAAYRAEHGKPITRDQLRIALRVGGERATKLLRRLRAETTSERPLSIPHQQTS